MRGRLIQAALVAAVGATTLSPVGLDHIKTYEGKVNTAYADPAWGEGLPTICYGHTATAKMGQRRNDADCLTLLRQDVDEATKQVLRLVKVPLTQGELDAYVSFVFNIGPTKFSQSTALHLLNAGDRVGACRQLQRWKYANGRALPGLAVRRGWETRTCLRDLPTPTQSPL